MSEIDKMEKACEMQAEGLSLHACEQSWHKFKEDCDIQYKDCGAALRQELRGMWAYDIYQAGYYTAKTTACDIIDRYAEENAKLKEQLKAKDSELRRAAGREREAVNALDNVHERNRKQAEQIKAKDKIIDRLNRRLNDIGGQC